MLAVWRVRRYYSGMWYTYIIECDNGQLYTGITTDVERRWREHCQGKAGARFFRTSAPRKLCRVEPYQDRSSASKREAAIKKLSRPQKLKLLSSDSPLPVPALSPACRAQ
ncbi:GIY-YIG nuclease family protein [Gilvimarinus chinensis]|uniref:GIY-YIG nuclease family protein n=1 Tax=Gilvimarinus chinensis TaxID=396005 RepID=UPI00037A1B66|nr:GIY-YIG nuclease family protein [Gilvimarinus chinensis]